MKHAMTVFCGAAFLASPLGAQVTPVGPFQGAFSDDFESQALQGPSICVAEGVLEGNADACGFFGSASVLILESLSQGPGQPTFTPRSGAQMFHTSFMMEITFDQPVRRFGGYFGSTWVNAGNATFIDPAGTVVADELIFMDPCSEGCTWTWNGWELPPGTVVQRIVLSTPTALGGYMQLEDLELDFESACSATYCTAGTSASGCQAAISAAGVASATAASGFVLNASGVEMGKDGLFFFGTGGRQANPWGNGTSYQCAVPPVTRGGLLDGVVSNGPCDGAFSQDLNALWAAKPAKNPGAGALVQAQFWYRDPQNSSNQPTSLSDAIEFCLGP